KPAEAYRPQKDRLSTSYQAFDSARRNRLNRRTLDIPAHIAYVEIHFYIVFGDNAPFKTKTTFENKFGLSPVMYSNFNNTVLFAISNEDKFERFVELLSQFVASADDVFPQHKEYAIITTIHDFEFLSSDKILDYSRDQLLLDIVNVHDHIY